MLDIAKLFSVLALISYLLRKKFRIGNVLLAASALLALLYFMSPHKIATAIKAAATNQVTIKLTLSLTLIRVIELLLRENNVLSEMMQASKSLFRNRKLIIISMPLLIGMLPSLGGAYFSAPMVEESTKGLKMGVYASPVSRYTPCLSRLRNGVKGLNPSKSHLCRYNVGNRIHLQHERQK